MQNCRAQRTAATVLKRATSLVSFDFEFLASAFICTDLGWEAEPWWCASTEEGSRRPSRRPDPLHPGTTSRCRAACSSGRGIQDSHQLRAELRGKPTSRPWWACAPGGAVAMVWMQEGRCSARVFSWCDHSTSPPRPPRPFPLPLLLSWAHVSWTLVAPAPGWTLQPWGGGRLSAAPLMGEVVAV